MSTNYFLISVPIRNTSDVSKTKTDLTQKIRNSGDKETQLWEFDLPQLKVGNIDSLIFLSDALKKTATSVEGTIRKVAAQHLELVDNQEPKQQDKKVAPVIEVRNARPEEALTRFHWEDAHYPRRKSLPELTQSIKAEIFTTEKELRENALEYNTILQKITQLNANESGNLMTRDINAVIKEYNQGKPPNQQFKPIESRLAADTKALIEEYNAGSNQKFCPYLTTLYVVVPKNDQKNWLRGYEFLLKKEPGEKSEKAEKAEPDQEDEEKEETVKKSEQHWGVVPGSTFKLIEDNESCLFSVVVFSADVDEFKNVCRSRRYTVRKNDPSTMINEEEKNTLRQNQQKQKKKIIPMDFDTFWGSF